MLEEIIGLTTKNSNGLASNASKSTFAYLAGSVVIVYNVNFGTQSHLMVSHRPPKRLSCVAFSQDGRFVAAGEVLICSHNMIIIRRMIAHGSAFRSRKVIEIAYIIPEDVDCYLLNDVLLTHQRKP